jgi:tRNA pseudouridine38-40 synthase
MVRNIAGVLLAIGEGSQSVGWAKQVLLSKDRCQAGITAPAAGLYLVGVSYPDHYNLSALCYTPPCLLNPTPQLTDFPV